MPCPIPLSPDTVVCGNGGQCIANESRCECVDGWSGKGDFTFGEQSCNIYLPAIKHIWIPVFVVHLIVATFSFEYLAKLLARVSKSWIRKTRLPNRIWL